MALPCYAIVEFISSNTVSIVPVTWVTNEEDNCLWPPKSTRAHSRVMTLVKKLQAPEKNWDQFRVRVLAKANTFKRALEKQKEAEDTSDLNTATESETNPRTKRRSKKPRLAAISSDSSDRSEDEAVAEIAVPPPSSFSSSPSRDLTDPPTSSSSFHDYSSHASENNLLEKSHASLLSSMNSSCSYVVGEDIFRNLVTKVLELNQNVKILTSVVQHSLQSKNNEDLTCLPEDIKLPLATLDEVMELEGQLQSNESLKEKMIVVLRDVGGRKVDEFIRRTMTYVMTNDVAKRFNLTGRNDKQAFCETILCEVVYNAAKRNGPTAKCSRKDVEMSLSKWFVGTRDRGGNRSLRMKRSSDVL